MSISQRFVLTALYLHDFADRLGDCLRALANRGKVLVVALIVDYVLCGTAYALIEHKGPIASMWWAIVTGFTVGYGDFYPSTTAGRGVATFLIISAAILWLLAGAYIVSRLVQDANEFTHDEQEQIKQDIASTNAKLSKIMAHLGISEE